MALTKTTPTSLGTASGIAASGSWTSSFFDVSDAVAAEIECIFTFGSAPTSGNINIEVYASQDGSNTGDEPINTYATEAITATSYRIVYGFDVLPYKNILIYITNNTDQAVDISVNAIKTTV